MSDLATAELGLAPAVAVDNDNFDVFSSLRGGAESDNFSSGAGDIAEEATAGTDEAVSSLDLVAVASGEAELNTVTNSKPKSKETSAPVNPEQCQKYGTIACVGCDFALLCAERQAAMVAKNNESQPTEQLSTLEQLLREDDVPGEIIWARPSPDDFDGGELPVADSPRVVETSADKLDGPTEKITPQEQGGKTSTSEMVGTSGEDMKTEAAEVSSPPSEVKTHVIDVTSDADDDNKQSMLEPLDTPAQAETAPVSLAINKDTQTGDENYSLLKNEAVDPMANENKGIASVVENAYDSDETTALPSIETPSIEHQKEEDFVIAGSKSANSEPSRAVENDEGATPVFKQQHLAARFEVVKADKSATTGPIDNSGTKASTDAQPSEINIDAAADYNNFIKSTDSADVEQPKHVIPTVANMSPPQEQEDAINLSVEYEIADHGPTRPDIVNKLATHEVMRVTHETDETVGLEAMKTAPPVGTIALSKGKNQIDLSPELNEELAVDKRVYETQTPLVEQLYHDDATVECCHGKDNEFWAEEDMVFFVEQQSPAVEPEVSSAEVVAIALPMEATTAREEVDDLKLSVDDEIGVNMDSVEQLDNFKTASVPEITKGYDSNPAERVVIPTSPAVELTPDAELDEPVESELGEQNDLAVAGAVDNYGYNSEMSTVSDNILVVNNHPSLGLWSDDSRLSPEEETTATVQSGTDDASLVSRLVGVLVVAMCVVRGRRARATLSSR